MFPVLFFVGPVGIRTAVVVVVVAVCAGAWVAARRLRGRGMAATLVHDFVAPALVAGLVGARLVHALAFDPAWYLSRPSELLAIWKGGFAEEGGFLGGLAASIWFCRRRGVGFWTFGDALAPGVALTQAIARVGALLGGSGYGTPTAVPWAATFSDPNAGAPLGIPLHPTQMYEALAALLLTAILLAAERGIRAGELSVLLILGLALQRGFFDLVRGDAIWIADWVTSGQVVAILVAAASVFALARGSQRVAGHGAMERP